MIFTSVAELSNNQEKRFFKEQVDVFIRLIEVSCEKYDVENYDTIVANARHILVGQIQIIYLKIILLYNL